MHRGGLLACAMVATLPWAMGCGSEEDAPAPVGTAGTTASGGSSGGGGSGGTSDTGGSGGTGLAGGSGGSAGDPCAGIDPGAGDTPLVCDASGSKGYGDTVVITGLRLGANPLDSESLAGALGNIEQGSVGQPLSGGGWNVSPDTGGFRSPVYDDSRSHSGTQAVRCSISDGKWGSGFSYDRGTAITEVYVTWWVYFSPAPGEGGQWKMWRLRPSGDVNDRPGEIMSSSWYETDHTHSQQYVILFCDDPGGAYFDCYPGQDGGLRWLGGDDAPEADAWTRMEYYAVASSSSGARDGSLVLDIHKQVGAVKNVVQWEDSIITRAANVPEQWQHVHFQNYWGNGNADNVDVWLDDVHIQFGSRARVELGDTPDWATHTHREIQPASSWSDSSVTVELNSGSFTAGETAYLFVVDEEGVVSNGLPIQLE